MPDQHLVELEMGYRDDEFGTVLQGTFTGEKSAYRCVEIETNHWKIEQAGEVFDLDIAVAVQSPRVLGMFKLPVLQVKFTFGDTTAEPLRDKFFHRFHQYFHKGGG
jgi:hypothetical protein